MLGLAGFPAAIQLFGMIFLPESPRWLARNEREDEAIDTLLKIRLKTEFRSRDLIMAEYNEIKDALKYDLKLGYCASVKLLFQESKKAAIVGIGL
jgi:hypothetical protein